jgi:hypothetical protein
MASPYTSRSRLSRSSLSTPHRSNGSGSGSSSVDSSFPPKSPSTPFEIYQRNNSPLASTPTSSIPRSRSAFLPPSSISNSQLALGGAYRRNTGWGSPGVAKSSPRYSHVGAGSSGEVNSPRPSGGLQKVQTTGRTPKFIRKKSLKQR